MITFDRVRTILVTDYVFSVEPELVTPQAMLVDELGFDSLDLVSLTMELEDEFGIEIDDEAAERLRTVADVVALVDGVCADAAADSAGSGI